MLYKQKYKLSFLEHLISECLPVNKFCFIDIKKVYFKCVLTLEFDTLFRWYTMVHADGSISQTLDYLKQHGLEGFINIWPRPTAIAWKIIACYAAFEAALQLLLPGKRVEGPVSPAGNQPVYKVFNAERCISQSDILLSPHLNFYTW